MILALHPGRCVRHAARSRAIPPPSCRSTLGYRTKRCKAIAGENNLSETAFLVDDRRCRRADYDLRWFTPTTEVALCGHATLASGHVDPVAARPRPRARALPHARRRACWRSRGRERLPHGASRLDAPRRLGRPRGRFARWAAKRSRPSTTLRRYAVALYGSEAEVRALTPGFRGFEGTSATRSPSRPRPVTRRRHRQPRLRRAASGIDEDPVTGSAHGRDRSAMGRTPGSPAHDRLLRRARAARRMACEVADGRVRVSGAAAASA